LVLAVTAEASDDEKTGAIKSPVTPRPNKRRFVIFTGSPVFVFVRVIYTLD
jgi:hypothetical protein